MVIDIKENISLSPYTVFKIGGFARFFVDVKNSDELQEALLFAKQKGAPFFILGAGSNLLVSDAGFSGLVIRMSKGAVTIEGEKIMATSDMMMAQVVVGAMGAELAGVEWGIGIPGTVGGSVRGNAGCFGGEIKDVVESVRFIDARDASLREFTNPECEFGYRDSIFKKYPEWVIVSATFGLTKGERARIQEGVREITKKRVEKQDIGAKCCGCVFKNTVWPSVDRVQFAAQFPETAQFQNQSHLPASLLIDHAGLKGARRGGVVISPKHANFFVNEGGASAEDVRQLIVHAKEVVRARYGVAIEEEIQYLGF